LDEAIRTLPSFPPRLRVLIEHMILSHHGQLEFGSPKLPAFAEALLLHHIDNLDSKMEAMRASLEKDRSLDGFLTSFNPALERQIFRKDRFLEEGASWPVAPSSKPADAEVSGKPAAAPNQTPSSPAPVAGSPAAASAPSATPFAGGSPPASNTGPSPNPAAAKPQILRSPSVSPFAEQLQKALGGKDTNRKD
jgi:3'-5' exoribonuclease